MVWQCKDATACSTTWVQIPGMSILVTERKYLYRNGPRRSQLSLRQPFSGVSLLQKGSRVR